MKKFSDCILLLTVLAIIVCPLLFFNFKSGQVSVVENRALAERASIRSHPDVFMKSIDACVDDRIGFRDEMMRMYNRVIYGQLRGNHSNVIVGEDGWLFYADDLPDYTGSNIDQATMERRVEIVKAIDTWCRERGIIFVLAVGPNKSTIYSEYMPNSIYHEPHSVADRLMERLREEGVNVFYPKEELIAHKADKELYYRLDTHWNEFGSRYLLGQIVESLALEKVEIPVRESTSPNGDLLTMLGIGENGNVSLAADVVPNPNGEIVTLDGMRELELKSEDTLKFVCYRDSFTSAMVNYYSYYFNGPIIWSHCIDSQVVEQEAPQVLILSTVERFFGAAIDQNDTFLTLTK